MEHWAVIILAAGYGSRLNRDIDNDPTKEFTHLSHLPKPLLPIAGVPLIDYWMASIRTCKRVHISSDDVFIVTNNKFYPMFLRWCSTRGIPSDNVINDGTTANENRLGAAADINLCITQKRQKIGSKGVLIIAGDTLFREDFSIDTFLSGIPAGHGGIVHYNVPDEEVSKRGIIELFENTNVVKNLLEKPQPNQTTSRKACPALYAYRSDCFDSISHFIDSTSHLALDQRDAPGTLLGWLLEHGNLKVISHEISGRFDIGNLAEYKSTLKHFQSILDTHITSQLPHETCEKCFARIGLLGNPSDGFHGKTLSMLLGNFYAQVSVSENTCHSGSGGGIRFVPHPVHDPNEFESLEDLQFHCAIKGFYGGLRLLHATCKAFSWLCFRSGQIIHLQRSFTMSYDTNIPRMVGLSGSSAIIVAAMKALLKFFGLKISDLNIKLEELPLIILDVERKELGISAGLQDRVIQCYGGLVHMDFTDPSNRHGGVFTRYDPALLPPLYLAYNTNAGGESGKVHSTVRDRWHRQDCDLVHGMKTLGSYADEALTCLLSTPQNIHRLADLMDMNFAMRRSLYGDEVVGSVNISMVQLAQRLGFAAKFTGSGGALICLKRDTPRCLDSENEERIRKEFLKHGFEFVRVVVPLEDSSFE